MGNILPETDGGLLTADNCAWSLSTTSRRWHLV